MAVSVCAVHGVDTLDLTMVRPMGPPLTGQKIAGRYAIEALIAEGGAGAIYRAKQVCVDRTVAVKIMRREMFADLKWVRRFYREARLASRLGHPNVVHVVEFGVDPQMGAPFIAMEYIEGTTLESMLGKGRRFSERRAAELLHQVARALAEAHRRGIVHCDLKPENIMVSVHGGEEHLKVLDFGIAKTADTEANDLRLVGTPAYMSPEQILDKPIDFRADLYSLGCILHELLEGTPPFSGETPLRLLFGHIQDPVPPLSARLVDGAAPSMALSRLHDVLLAKELEDRPSSTDSVVRLLASIARGALPKTVLPQVVESGATVNAA
jgi:eukaryotic-like serine/threonine-protein kinase